MFALCVELKEAIKKTVIFKLFSIKVIIMVMLSIIIIISTIIVMSIWVVAGGVCVCSPSE